MDSRHSLRSGKTILIVDDHPDTLGLWLEYMRREGYDVVGASDAHQALGVAAAQKIDLLLTDIQMPVLNGWDLFSRLRESFPTLRGIVVSAHAMPQHIVESTKRGLDRHLVKPIDPDELTQAVDELLLDISRNSDTPPVAHPPSN